MSITMNRLPTPMFQASTSIRGHQILTSAKPRMAASVKKVSRPTWEAAPRTRLPMTCSIASVRLAIEPLSCPSMPAKATPQPHLRCRRLLVRWNRRHGRELTWRRTRDPYQVLVAEIMLQQTPVSRVEPYYHRFLERFPSLHRLAAAPAASVREAWDGLGYYRRAANLHLLAQQVVTDRDGVIPAEPDQLRQLPG